MYTGLFLAAGPIYFEKSQIQSFFLGRAKNTNLRNPKDNLEQETPPPTLGF